MQIRPEMQRSALSIAHDAVLPSQKQRRTVVIVDDSDLCRKATSRMLERAGHTTICMANPIGFTAVLRDRRPDLALVDVNMPTLRGDHLVSIATKHAHGGGCPIVLFSDRPAVELGDLVRRCGAAGYVQKSSDWPGVLKAIEKFLPAR